MNLAGIDVNLVVALHALLQERNVSRAAKRLGLGQSATSHALARLRAQLDDALLVRTGRTFELTPKAKALLEPVAVAVAHLERVFEPPEPFVPGTSRATFRIAATDNLALYVLPRLTQLLAKEATHVDVRFLHLPKDWQTALLRDDFDLKLGRKYRVGPPLESEDLFRDELVCVVRRGHPISRLRATKAPLTLRQYAALSHILVAPGETERGFMDDLLAREGLERRVALTVPHFLVALFAVASSDHALTIPARLVDIAGPALRLRALPLPSRPPSYVLSQVWAQRSTPDAGHQWLRSMVRRAVRAAPSK